MAEPIFSDENIRRSLIATVLNDDRRPMLDRERSTSKPQKEESAEKKFWKAALADWASTAYFLANRNTGMHEVNPMFSGLNDHPARAALIPAAGIATDLAGTWLAKKFLGKKARNIGLTAATSFRANLAKNNMRNAQQEPVIRDK